MKFEDRAPEPEVVQLAPGRPAVQVFDLQPFAPDIEGAIKAAGPEETAAALAQVQSGQAPPEALLAWIDDLRTFEHEAAELDPVDEQQGFVPDFLMDTCIAGGTLDQPPAGTGTGTDDDYFFSAVRRRTRAGERSRPRAPTDPAADKDKGKDKDKSGR